MSWTELWTRFWKFNEEHLEENPLYARGLEKELKRYLLWTEGDTRFLTTSLALLGITADSTSSYTEYGHKPGENEWH